MVWGSDLPIRYDIRVRGDSVSMADVAWIYPTLPTEGVGSTVLTIRNDPRDLDILDYALTDLDVRSTGSRLRGQMTYGVGGPMLIVKDVDLAADPVDFALFETLAGEPFPLPWRGTITGTIRGPGGPLDRFRVDDAAVLFRDANVPGAIARGSGRGTLDITTPSEAVFRDFTVAVETFDLRTPQFLNPDFPRLGGTVAGGAVLDSIWTDVRVRDLRLTHLDGPGTPTQLAGGGRVTLEPDFVRYDLDLTAAPLSFTALARSYPLLPLRGEFAGPMRVQGVIEDLEIQARLAGGSGTLDIDGRLDALLPLYGAAGTLSVERLDVARLLERADLPTTDLTARLEGAVRGSSAADIAGDLVAAVDRSMIDGIGIFPSSAQIEFGDGRVRLTDARVESTIGSVRAVGGLGLAAGARDSMFVRVTLDSLGALRRYLAPTVAGDTTAPDPLRGRLTADLTLAGTLARPADSLAPRPAGGGLAVRGTVGGQALDLFGTTALRLDATAALTDLLTGPSGEFSVSADTVRGGRLLLTTARLDGVIVDGRAGRLTARATSDVGQRLLASAELTRVTDGATITVDTLVARIDPSPQGRAANRLWTLERPATISVLSSGLTMDTLVVRGPDEARLALGGSLPATDPIAFAVRGQRLPLRDLGQLAELRIAIDGLTDMTVDVAGTRATPLIAARATASGAQFGEVRLNELRARADYAERRLTTDVTLSRDGSVVLEARATLPVDLALAARTPRVLDEPIDGRIRAEAVDLSVLEAFTTSMRDASGLFTLNADLAGTLRRPLVTGRLAIANGATRLPDLGTVALRDIEADVRFIGDSIEVRHVAAASGASRASSLLLRGGVGLEDLTDPRFGLELQLQEFNVIGRPRLADLDVSTTPNLRLRGPMSAPTLSGGVRVERGTVFLPELSGKQVFALDDLELYQIIDSTRLENRMLLPSPPPAMVQNLTMRNVEVEMGDEVWLRGPEANVKLGGRLRVTTSAERPRGTDEDAARLALDGALTAVRGTYRLNLGVVQRTFEIEQGTVRFFGEPEFNPTLDIRALYTVRRVNTQAAQPDVQIRAIIGGTLADPELALAGVDDDRLSESDALSYLVLGVPSLAVGGVQQTNQQTATALALTSLGSYLTDRAAGGVFDYVSFQTGFVDPQERRLAGVSQSILAGSRLGLGVQLSDRAFVSVNAGLCQFVDAAGGRGFSAGDFAGALGVKVDYRLSPPLSLSAGVEPGANNLYCRAGGAVRGFAPTPQQWTFDLFRTWRF